MKTTEVEVLGSKLLQQLSDDKLGIKVLRREKRMLFKEAVKGDDRHRDVFSMVISSRKYGVRLAIVEHGASWLMLSYLFSILVCKMDKNNCLFCY